ncbi:MAG: Npt1/Npt2 family nucleotide transporter [Bryobacterales bacterium]|nr:Npt1/Npt2 family nucleotide transporter [Bryobacterales bacterium]
MTNSLGKPDRAPWIAIFGAVFLMAHFISGKAARDSLFLVNFPVEALPRMTIFAAVTSLLLVLLWSRKLATKSPAVLVPWALFGASVLQFVLWGLYFLHPHVSSVLFYLYMIGPNAILLSSYWSLLNERFDPRQAKRLFGRVAAGGTFGGLASGVVADQFADVFGPSILLPFQGTLQFFAFLLIRKLSLTMPARRPQATVVAPDFAAGLRILRKNRYLFTLASLVFLVTMSANLLDYVFKSGVTELVGRGENLVTFFALFYAFSGLVTFLMQTFVAQVFFERLGLTQSLFALPVSYFLGVLSHIAIPGLGGLIGMRGAETVTRGSIYRSGYEICYTPVTNQEKRATKTIVDVGADRLGEAAGGFLVQGLLLAGLTGGSTGLLILGCVLSVGAGFITFRLGRLYVGTLENSLISRAREVEERDALPNWSADSIVLGSLAEVPSLSLKRSEIVEQSGTRHIPTEELAPPAPGTEPRRVRPKPGDDPLLEQIARLRSSDYATVREALLKREPVDPALVPLLVRLLAWDEVAELVIRVLRKAPCPLEGQLADAMLNANEDFAIRRRIPRILGNRPLQITAEALLQGLRDQRFEVRFRCGKALSAITSADAGLIVDKERILRAVEREFFVSKTVWSSYKLLEHVDDSEEKPYFDEVLKDRTNKGLEHVFTLLSMVLPREPLQIAFKGLHTNDPHLRGTALEYLESILPPNIRERLWPFLEDSSAKIASTAARRSREEILDDLRRSNYSIIVNLEELAQKRAESAEQASEGEGAA